MTALRSLLMVWVFLAGATVTGLIGPNRVAVREEFGLSDTAYGAGLAVIQICAAGAVLLLAGRLARRNPVHVLMAALGVLVLGFGAAALSHSLAGAAIAWALVSAGLALGSIVNNISMDLWRRDPRRGIVLLHGFNAGGKVAGPLVAAACLMVGWRWSFGTLGILTLATLAAFFALRSQTKSALAAADPPAPAAAGRFSAAAVLFVLGIAMIAGGEAAFVSLLPQFLYLTRGVSEQAATLALTVHLVGLMAGRFAVALYGGSLSHKTIIALCLAAGLGAFPSLLSPSWPIILAGLFVLGFMFSGTWPTFYAAAAARWLPDRRRTMPYRSALGNVLGISLCLFVSSALAERHLLAAMFFGPAALWAFGLLYVSYDSIARGRRPVGAED